MNSLAVNMSKTLTPLTFFLNLFGLSYNIHKDNFERPAIWLCRVKRILVMGAFFGCLTAFSMYYKICYLSDDFINISVRITDQVQSVYDYCQYIIDLIFVYKFGRHIYREYFKQYTAIDHIIGTGSCAEIRRRIITLVTFTFLMWLTTSLLDFAAWSVNYGWTIPTMFAVAYLYFFIKILTNLDFTSQTLHIEIRLRIMGDIIQSYYSPAETETRVSYSCLQNKEWFNKAANPKMQRRETLKKSSTSKCHELSLLSSSYLLLTEQCAFVNQMFGIRILLNCLSILIDMVRFSNLAVRIITGQQTTSLQTDYYYWLPIVSTVSRLLSCMFILINMVGHCERVYRQTERIISILDHLLIYKHFEPEQREAAVELRGLVLQRPINFHLANFVRLDFSMLLSTASVVVTYTIILLQTRNEK